MDSGGHDLTTLIGRIQAGDQAAMEKFYDVTVKRAYASAVRITGNAADSHDVICEVYLRMWRMAHRYDQHRGQPIQWIMVMVRNSALDCLRRRRLAARALAVVGSGAARLSAPMPGPEQELQQVEMVSLIRGELSRLPSVQSRVIRLAFFEGLSHSQIAARINLPLGTVKSHINRALRGLRKILGKQAAFELVP